MKVLVINGPNINMLGVRERNIYGDESYEALIFKIKEWSKILNIHTEIFHSNSEGCIIDKIQESYGIYDGMIINPGAYTHYSIAILDALKSIEIPIVEVHISNIHKREEFRKKSVTAEGAMGIISGFGQYSYKLALEALINFKNI